MSDAPLRLAIVHRSPLLCDALRHRLERESDDVEVVAAESRPSRALAGLRAGRCDVAVVDGGLERADLIELCRAVAEELPGTRVLVASRAEWSDEPPAADGVALAEAGACGFVAADAGPAEWVAAARRARDGRSRCSVALARALARRIGALADAADAPRPDERPATRLSGRETEILELVAAGLVNKDIARRLGIRVATVKNHVHRILGKLDVGSRREAARVACRHGLLRPVGSTPSLARAVHGE